jgi:hypothetical protein
MTAFPPAESHQRTDFGEFRPREGGFTMHPSERGRSGHAAKSPRFIQPCHMVFASEECRNRLVAALIDEAQRRPPNIAPARVGSSGRPLTSA